MFAGRHLSTIARIIAMICVRMVLGGAPIMAVEMESRFTFEAVEMGTLFRITLYAQDDRRRDAHDDRSFSDDRATGRRGIAQT